MTSRYHTIAQMVFGADDVPSVYKAVLLCSARKRGCLPDGCAWSDAKLATHELGAVVDDHALSSVGFKTNWMAAKKICNLECGKRDRDRCKNAHRSVLRREAVATLPASLHNGGGRNKRRCLQPRGNKATETERQRQHVAFNAQIARLNTDYHRTTKDERELMLNSMKREYPWFWLPAAQRKIRPLCGRKANLKLHRKTKCGATSCA